MNVRTIGVDVVVVAYRSSRTLRRCVKALAAAPAFRVIVVDNDSPEDERAAVADLDVEFISAGRNGGFSFGCNLGASAGNAPFVLFLNPDATIDADALQVLAGALERDQSLGLVAPRIVTDDDKFDPSQRRFPRLRTTFSQALFLHRLFPRAAWSDELIRDAAEYDRPSFPDWVSGACMLVRRSALADVGGLDEGFFLYLEDTDLCRRLQSAGYRIAFDPAATMIHVGAGSAPRSSMAARLALSRVRYARKHDRPAVAFLQAVGIVVGEVTHTVVSLHRPPVARGHAAAVWAMAMDAATRRRREGSGSATLESVGEPSNPSLVRSQAA